MRDPLVNIDLHNFNFYSELVFIIWKIKPPYLIVTKKFDFFIYK